MKKVALKVLLKAYANLYRNTNKNDFSITEITDEVKRITKKSISEDGVRETLIKFSKNITKKEEKIFLLNDEARESWKSEFHNNLIQIKNLKLGEIFTRNELTSIFRHSGMRGIDFSKRTYSLILVSNENKKYYKDGIIKNGKILYTGEGLTGDQTLTGNNLTLANSLENELPIYMFFKDKELKYHYQGEFKLDGEPYQEQENDRLVYKFPLKLIDYVEEDYTSYEGYTEVVESVLRIAEDINVYSVSNESLNFVKGPMKISKYNHDIEKRKSNRTSKPDYIAEEIIKIKQGEKAENDVYEYEISKVMQYEVDGLVEQMREFFENKKDDEGYDILSFDIDEDRNISKMYIEVKSTKGGERTPIEISSSEVEFAKENIGSYYIYRVINSDSNNRYVKVINGEELFNDFKMVPSSYRVYGK